MKWVAQCKIKKKRKKEKKKIKGETTPRHKFLFSDSQCLPPGDPIILCAKQGSPITGKSFIFHYCDSHFHIVRRLSCSPKCNTYNAEMVESWTQVARNETILSLPISPTHALFWLLEVFLGVAKIISFFFSLLFGVRERIILTNA